MKGTLLYELFKLNEYWYKTFSRNADDQLASVHQYGPHAKQYLIHFSPAEKRTSKPIILYYHGGGWIFGKPEIFAKKAHIFTSQGFEFIVPCYRKVPRYNADHVREDLNLTLHFLYKYLEVNNFKDRKIILGGTSAGGNLVSLIYFQKELLEQSGFVQDDFIGMFLTAPPLDLFQMKTTPVLYSYAGGKSSERYRNASPLSHLAGSTAIKILSFHGTRDAIVNLKASQTFFERFDELHPNCLENNLLNDHGHIESASWAHTDNATRKRMLQWLEEISGSKFNSKSF